MHQQKSGNSMTEIIKACQYLRMSTEKQVYSIDHQTYKIAEYATRNGLQIIETFADEGKSGVSLKGRSELQRLLADVISGQAKFDAILVYDVSRWGRFQDVDESAHYEFLCNKAGIKIHYCEEMFNNDGSVASSIFKSLKRIMAGEYSRELSSKVSSSKLRLATHGYRVGGVAPYGLRRLLIDSRGHPKSRMEIGEQKSLRSDWVTLTLGPKHEVDAIKKIFKLIADGGKSLEDVAKIFNRRKIKTIRPGGVWAAHTIRSLVRNEVYLGSLIYNKRSYKFKIKVKRNNRSEWAIIENAFPAIVDEEMFKRANVNISNGIRKIPRHKMLDDLRSIFNDYGYLTGDLINRSRGTTSTSTIVKEFGSLKSAYRAMGYCLAARRSGGSQACRKLRYELTVECFHALKEYYPNVSWTFGSFIIVLDDNIKISVVIGRHQKHGSPHAYSTELPRDSEADVVVFGVPEDDESKLRSIHLIPGKNVPKSGYVQVNMKMTVKYQKSRILDLGKLHERISSDIEFQR